MSRWTNSGGIFSLETSKKTAQLPWVNEQFDVEKPRLSFGKQSTNCGFPHVYPRYPPGNKDGDISQVEHDADALGCPAGASSRQWLYQASPEKMRKIRF